MRKTSKLNRMMLAAALALTLACATSGFTEDATKKRTFLGVSVSPADDTLRQQLKLAKNAGLKVDKVLPDSPAQAAGLRQHDVLEKLNEQVLFTVDQLMALVRSFEPGDEVKLAIIRDGSPLTLAATLGETDVVETKIDLGSLPEKLGGLSKLEENLRKILGGENVRFGFEFNAPPPRPKAFLGVEVKDVDPSLSAQLGLDEGTGVVVGHVVEDSPAEKAELHKYDLITELDAEPIKGPSDFAKRLRQHKKGDVVKLNVIRANEPREIEATLSERTEPQPNQFLDDVIQRFRVIPKIQVITRSGPDGDSVLLLKDGGGKELRTDVAVEPGAGTTETRTVVVKSRHDRAKTGELDTGSDVYVSGETKMTQQNLRLITIKSDDYTITIEEADGNGRAVVKDAEGEVIFQGPINTEDERAKLPAKVREQIEKIEKDTQLKLQPGKNIEEIKILKPAKDRDVVQENEEEAEVVTSL